MSVHQLRYPIFGDTEENRSHSPWGGGSHLLLPTYETSEGPKDFVHFPLLFYPFMVWLLKIAYPLILSIQSALLKIQGIFYIKLFTIHLDGM